jgi:hypothetical protein
VTGADLRFRAAFELGSTGGRAEDRYEYLLVLTRTRGYISPSKTTS